MSTVIEVKWSIAEMGRRYVTEGVPGGEWCLDAPSRAGDTYILHLAGTRRLGVEISGSHGLYYAIDVATGYVEEMVRRDRGL